MQTHCYLQSCFPTNFYQKQCGNDIYEVINFQNKGQEEKNEWRRYPITIQNRDSN